MLWNQSLYADNIGLFATKKKCETIKKKWWKKLILISSYLSKELRRFNEIFR